MRIRQLEAFRATVITGTITAAAKSMRTTQPTVSRMLIQLEEEIGIPLFRREKGRVVLTNEGMRFYHRVDEVFTSITSLGRVAEDLRRATFREVRIISTPALAMTVVPDLMKQLVTLHPDIRAKLITLDNNSYFGVNVETEYDIVLGHRIGFETTMEQITLAEVDFVCVLPEDHPLATRETILVEDLEGQSIISLLDEKHRLFLRHEKVFQDANVNVTQNIFCHSSSAAYAMVGHGLGLALMEPFSARLWQHQGVVIRPFRPRLTYEFVAGLKPGTLQSVAMSQIIGLARDIFKQYASETANQGLLSIKGDPAG